jgi:hypothetical protein
LNYHFGRYQKIKGKIGFPTRRGIEGTDGEIGWINH